MIKVCGMRDVENVQSLSALNPDLVGFIFYPASPRYMGESPPKGFFDAIPEKAIKTGVFVDAEMQTINDRVHRFGLQAVQLHGHESPELCKQVMKTGVKVIKAFRISESTVFEEMLPYIDSTNWFLFDTKTRIPGGSGEQFKWGLLEKYRSHHPFFLSGGIGQGDAGRILALDHPALIGVDINSRFETAPGVKDVEKVSSFFRKIRGSEE